MKRHEDRRNEILDTAQALFYREGYESTSIAQLIDAVGVAKGTFYHYFSSKEELLDELIERGYAELIPRLDELARQTERSAVERLNEVFAISTRWKADNRELIVESARVLFHDDNIRLRRKNDEKATEEFAPVLSRIVAQGVERGELDTPYPEDAGELVFLLTRSMSDVITHLFLKAVEDAGYLEALLHKLQVIERAIERVIGAPENSIELADTDEIARLVTGSGPETSTEAATGGGEEKQR
jgi:AcrR family transcriptional regulator